LAFGVFLGMDFIPKVKELAKGGSREGGDGFYIVGYSCFDRITGT